MAEDVHHGVERYGRDSSRCTDIFGKFHDAVWSSSESEGGDVAETEAADGEFQRITED